MRSTPSPANHSAISVWVANHTSEWVFRRRNTLANTALISGRPPKCPCTATFTSRVTADIRPDTVFIPYHWAGKKSANQLTVAAQDPISKIPQYKVCACRVRKAAGPPAYDAELEPQQ